MLERSVTGRMDRIQSVTIDLRCRLTDWIGKETTSKMLYGSTGTVFDIPVFHEYDLSPMGSNFWS